MAEKMLFQVHYYTNWDYYDWEKTDEEDYGVFDKGSKEFYNAVSE